MKSSLGKPFFATLFILLVSCSISAQERIFSEYQYDPIGNTETIDRDANTNPPAIDSVSPAVVRQNQTVQVTIQGSGLRGARLANTDGVFSFGGVQSTDSELIFTMQVSPEIDSGTSEVSVTTGLGTATASFTILPELPDLRIAPIPIVIQSGATLTLNISLSATDVIDHTVSVSSSNSNIVSPGATTLDFAQGSIANQTLQLVAGQPGRARLRFESTTLGNNAYDVTVTDAEFPLRPGEQEIIYSPQVGINKLFAPPPPPLLELGPFFDQITINKPVDAPPAEEQNIAVTEQIGVRKGTVFTQIIPTAIGAGVNNQTVTVNGVGLQQVDSINLLPDDGTSISNLAVAADGQSLSFTLSVASDVVLAQRQLLVSANGLRIAPARRQADRIYIGGLLPLVRSTSPIYFNRGDVRTVTVRGENFNTVRNIGFDNEADLAFSPPRINADGTELRFDLQIIGFARLGPRRLTLESVLGDAISINVDAAVINIEDRPPEVITPVVSALVGVARGDDIVLPPASQTLYSSQVGVQRGAILQSLSPNSRSQGASFSLSLQGVGLNTVASVDFLPAEGITAGDYIPSSDGRSASLQLDIAADATPGVRQIRLSNGVDLLNSVTGADRFTVTLPTAEIASITPLQIEQGASNVTLLIRGQRLNNANAVRFNPADGIVVNNVTANADGAEVQALISVAANATTGPRIVTVTTPGGATETAAMAGNTVNIVQQIISTITPVVSNAVGVVKETAPLVITRQVNSVSEGVGVLKEAPITPLQQDQFALSQQVGLTRGAIAEQITPSSLPIGAVGQSIVVRGRQLDDVTNVRTVPPEGITLNDTAIIAEDGNSIRFTADIDDDAEQSLRRVELQTASGRIPFITLDSALLRITDLQAEINSIEPIQERRGETFTLTIRGINFVDVQSVQATPAAGITFATPNVAADGRSLTVQVFIDNSASGGARVISVITNAGQSDTAALPANTFTVVSE